jgi:S1-C subfamily serine protease
MKPTQSDESGFARPAPLALAVRAFAVKAFVGGLLASALSCGPSYPESEYPAAPPPGVSASPDDYAPAPPGALWRKDVNDVLDAGLGKFLQRADLRAELREGTFVGFRIVELRPPAWWQGVDVVPGDVITRVNGMPIEQPTDAHAAFESLRKSDKLVVNYLREGQPRELSYSIIEKPAAAPPATAK